MTQTITMKTMIKAKALGTFFITPMVLNSTVFGMVTDAELEAQYGKAPQKMLVLSDTESNTPSTLSALSPQSGTTIQKMRADGEGSLVIGMNGISPVDVAHVGATDMGMALVSNQQDIEIEGEKAEILISGVTASPHTKPLTSAVHIGEMTATDGGISMGTNTGTIKIVRKKK